LGPESNYADKQIMHLSDMHLSGVHCIQTVCVGIINQT